MQDLLLDIKITIASLFDKVWILLVLYDNQFKTFSYSKVGVALYKQEIMARIEPCISTMVVYIVMEIYLQ